MEEQILLNHIVVIDMPMHMKNPKEQILVFPALRNTIYFDDTIDLTILSVSLREKINFFKTNNIDCNNSYIQITNLNYYVFKYFLQLLSVYVYDTFNIIFFKYCM